MSASSWRFKSSSRHQNMKYSIWIIPSEPVYGQIQKVIDELSEKYKGPRLEPHMTLVGGIDYDLPEIEKKIKRLSLKGKELSLTLGPVSFGTTYYQSVLVRVNSSAKLMQLNMDIKKILGLENNVFMPHLSLLYGDHSMSDREKIASSVYIPTSSFIVNEFVITPSTDNPKEWVHSAVVPFG